MKDYKKCIIDRIKFFYQSHYYLNNRFYINSIIILYIIIFGLILQNLRAQNLWFDESVQFWVSKGLNSDSEPFSKMGSVFDVIENNKYYNMDPGGFSVLLHFWTKISNHYFWLRILPFIFFLGIAITFIYLAYFWIKQFSTALLVGLSPIFYPMILNMGFEIRAYSMEALGSLLCIVCILQLNNKINNKKIVFWSFVLSFFILSRYAILISVFIASIFVIIAIIKQKTNFKKQVISIIIFLLPIFICILLVYNLSLKYQNPGLSAVSYLNYLKYSPQKLLTFKALAYQLVIFLLILLYVLRQKTPYILKYEKLLLFTILVNVLFLTLSIAGYYPWIPPFEFRSNRCISMITLVLLCISLAVAELVSFSFSKYSSMKHALIIFTITVFVFYRKNNLRIKLYQTPSDSESSVETNVQQEFQNQNNLISKYNKIKIDFWLTPSVKYFYEYGSLKPLKFNNYPRKFTFENSGRHSPGGFSVDLNLEDENIIVTSKQLDTLKYTRINGSLLFWKKL
jgi:hypothetical protein